jgi:hypothetical protein
MPPPLAENKMRIIGGFGGKGDIFVLFLTLPSIVPLWFSDLMASVIPQALMVKMRKDENVISSAMTEEVVSS